MGTDRERELAVKAAKEHVERTRKRLADGRATIDRLHESIEDTNRHIASVSEWIGETERALGEERARRAVGA
jgi:predicted  nucleic acid-binding Zn-ribbon protein